MNKALEILLKTKTAIATMGQYSLDDLHNAAAELEEAMKPKSCEGCKAYNTENEKCNEGVMVANVAYLPLYFFCKWYEPKEQL